MPKKMRGFFLALEMIRVPVPISPRNDPRACPHFPHFLPFRGEGKDSCPVFPIFAKKNKRIRRMERMERMERIESVRPLWNVILQNNSV